MPDHSAHYEAAMQRHMDTKRRAHGQHLWLPLACVALGRRLASAPPVSGTTTEVRQVGARAAAVTAERALPPMASRLEWLAIVVSALLSLLVQAPALPKGLVVSAAMVRHRDAGWDRALRW